MLEYDVLIVGAGHAGAQLAFALRQQKFEGSIALVGDEPHAPYERPPLSKDYLAGVRGFERILIRPEQFWVDRDIALLPGRRVTEIRPQDHEAVLSDGNSIRYRHLVWAAGGAPRSLTCNGHELAGVHSVRTRADVDRIMAELPNAERIVVIGGGYIGLEAAAVLSKLGKSVTVVEAMDRVLARVACEPLSRFFETEHREHGIHVRLSSQIECLEGDDAVRAVRLAEGEPLAADMVIVGIGIIPSIEPLHAAGADCPNGVYVDEYCRTSLPDVFAIGDCAAHDNPYAEGAMIRLESVQNATDQATTVAKFLTGSPEAYDAVPWFWSNQYDLKLQTVGLTMGYDDIVMRGEPSEKSFSLIYLRNGRVIALDCVNMVRDYVQGKALVAGRMKVSPSLLADTNIALKSHRSRE
jgi:3-phenylpropionate/trans-cinnamate dioxygenase ferredoxin reductase subunit